MPLEGKRVILREQRREDLPFLQELQNDMEVQAWSKALPPDYTDVMYIKRFEAREFSYDPDEARFVIIDKETGERVGHMTYSDLEPRFSTMLGIMTARKFWGSGLAFDAQETILKFVFCELGVRVVRLFTHSGIPRAVKLAERSGFQVSARMREGNLKYCKLNDALLMDILREEYFALHPELTDPLPGL